MAIKIRPASEPIPVSNLVIAIYAPPGVGKTTLAFTADRPLLLDFDDGAYRAPNRGDSVEVTKWADVSGLTSEDMEPFGTLVVDTTGRALDVLSADIIHRDAKAGSGGVLSMQGWGKLKGEFTGWLRARKVDRKDIVLIAHMSEKAQGDDMIERLDVQGGSKDEIYKSADAMGRIVIRNDKRWLVFDPTDTAYGKNPGRLPAIEIPWPIPADFLAGVIQRIKDALNEQTAAQRERAALLAEWQKALAGMSTAEHFNAKLPEVKAQPRPVQKMFADAAGEHGLVFDKDAGSYRAKPAEPVEAAQDAPQGEPDAGETPAAPAPRARRQRAATEAE